MPVGAATARDVAAPSQRHRRANRHCPSRPPYVGPQPPAAQRVRRWWCGDFSIIMYTATRESFCGTGSEWYSYNGQLEVACDYHWSPLPNGLLHT